MHSVDRTGAGDVEHPAGDTCGVQMVPLGLSLPEAMTLKKVMETRLPATFFGAVAVSIVGLGYLFNLVL
ncbi:MAG: hypothetical protein ABEL97_12885 [Salinibacter sp.]